MVKRSGCSIPPPGSIWVVMAKGMHSTHPPDCSTNSVSSRPVLQGGTSSILIRGRQADGSRWRIGLRDPFSIDERTELVQLDLGDCGISTSAVFSPDFEPIPT